MSEIKQWGGFEKLNQQRKRISHANGMLLRRQAICGCHGEGLMRSITKSTSGVEISPANVGCHFSFQKGRRFLGWRLDQESIICFSIQRRLKHFGTSWRMSVLTFCVHRLIKQSSVMWNCSRCTLSRPITRNFWLSGRHEAIFRQHCGVVEFCTIISGELVKLTTVRPDLVAIGTCPTRYTLCTLNPRWLSLREINLAENAANTQETCMFLSDGKCHNSCTELKILLTFKSEENNHDQKLQIWAYMHYVVVSKIQWKPFWLATQLSVHRMTGLGSNFVGIMRYSYKPRRINKHKTEKKYI